MMFTTPMRYMIAVVLDKDTEKVSEELLHQGVTHLVKVTEIRHDFAPLTSEIKLPISSSEVGDVRKRIEGLLRSVGHYPRMPEPIEITDQRMIDLEKSENEVNAIAQEVNGIRDKQRLLQQEIMKYEDIKRQIDQYKIEGGIAPLTTGQYSFISINTGSIKKERYQDFVSKLKGYPSLIITLAELTDSYQLLVVTMKRNEREVEQLFSEVGWSEIAFPEEISSLGMDITSNLEKKLRELQTQQLELSRSADKVVIAKKERLESLWIDARMTELLLIVQSYFRKTSRTVIFSGWVPESFYQRVGEGIRKAVSGRCYLEWSTPREVASEVKAPVNVPVKLRNPRIFAPFQMLVTNFGIPEYGTIDPTPVVVVLYLAMFGLMFPDAGQGAIIAILGALGTLFLKGKGKGIYNLSKLIVWCGIVATITGILVGSYFGLEWFKPFWFDMHGVVMGHPTKQSFIMDVFGILKLSILFGIFVIELGLLFNWINLIVKRKWIELLFDKEGLVGGWLYTGGIVVTNFMIQSGYREFPGFTEIMLLIGLPSLLLVVKKPLEAIYGQNSGNKEEVGSAGNTSFGIKQLISMGMDWAVELLEVFSRYLSNTLSFMRVAGFGIAHASLMTAFYELGRMASGGTNAPYNLSGYLVIVFGNLLVIALEGLSVGVQSLRLNYYEFFTKFFKGSGTLYKPVSLYQNE